MTDKSLTHQGPPTHFEAALHSVFVRRACGSTLKQAINDVGAFAVRTYYGWRRLYPDWIASIEQAATQTVQEQRRQAETALLNLTLETEIDVQRRVLTKGPEVVQGQIDTAIDPEAAAKDRTAAARFIRTVAIDGFAFEHGSPNEGPGDDDLGLPYNPHETDLTEATITLPRGSRVTVETPDVIEVEPGIGPVP